MNNYFWLHIKKCGGTSVRESLKNYKQIDRSKPQQFISIDKSLWNDNLNNYRVDLGEYDYKRALFAKKHLYKDEWMSLFKFTIIRNPYIRIVSAYNYLIKRDYKLYYLNHLPKKIGFLLFLKSLNTILQKKKPRHTATHIVPYYWDLTDNSDNLLIDNIYILEDLMHDLPDSLIKIGMEYIAHKNKNNEYDFNEYYTYKSKRIVGHIYKKDISLYESIKK